MKRPMRLLFLEMSIINNCKYNILYYIYRDAQKNNYIAYEQI